jgi:hypothetical protein
MAGLGSLQVPAVARLHSLQDTCIVLQWLGWAPCRSQLWLDCTICKCQPWLGWTALPVIGLDSLQAPAVARVDSLKDTSNGCAGLPAGTGSD